MLLRNTIAGRIVPARNFFKKFFKSLNKDPIETEKQKVNSFGKYDTVEPWQVSERREVPTYIPKPSYSMTGIPEEPSDEIEIKNIDQIECMRHSCMVAKRILRQIRSMIKVKKENFYIPVQYSAGYLYYRGVKKKNELFVEAQPGVTTDWLDHHIHDTIINNGAYPSPLNYRGFPKSVCTSVNNVACHGIPDSRPLRNGDIINVDVTVYLNGYHGDCSEMYRVGETDDEANRLIYVTELCLNTAIDICSPGEKFCNIGNVIEETAGKNGFTVIPVFLGHGIGSYFHGPPDIFHFANDYEGTMLPGMTFTIEPLLTQGNELIQILNDGWTAVTVDNARTAQMEHTILITHDGCDVLTC